MVLRDIILPLALALLLGFAPEARGQIASLRAAPPHVMIPKCGFSSFTSTDFQRLVQTSSAHTNGTKSRNALTANDRPTLHAFAFSPRGRFAVWYDTAGANAPSLAGRSLTGVPAYIDSLLAAFDYAYTVEIEQMGYDAPPPCDTLINAFDGKSQAVYTVYVLNLGADGIYGATRPLHRLGEGGGRGRFTAYTVVDNDYSEQDSVLLSGRKSKSYFTNGYDALRITAAHEFHHVIQLGSYGDSYRTSRTQSGLQERDQCALHELSSTWMERRVFPHVRDDRQFHPLLFGDAVLGIRPLSDGECLTGYVYTLFAEYLFTHWGDAVLRQMWELSRTVAVQGSLYQALDSAIMLVSKGYSSLDGAWEGFSRWMYFTNERASSAPLQERCADAYSLPGVAFAQSEEMTPPSASAGGMLRPLEMRFFRFIATHPNNAVSSVQAVKRDTIDVCVTAQHSRSVPTEQLSFLVMARPASNAEQRIDKTSTAVMLNSTVTKMQVYRNGMTARLIPPSIQPLPHPVLVSQQGIVRLALPEDFNSRQPIQCTIFTLQGGVVARLQLAPFFERNFLSVQWDGLLPDRTQIPSGFYGFIMEQNTRRCTGSILLQR
jgi:hypothetical protein